MDLSEAIAQHKNGMLELAERYYRDYLSNTNPKDHAAINLLGVLLYQKGIYPEAQALLLRAIDLNPEYSVAHCNLGVVFEATKNLDEARRHFERAVELRPDYWLALFNLGNVLHKLRRLSEAVSCFENVASIRPDYPDAHMNCGLAMAEAGDLQGAQRKYDRALELKPDYAEAWNNKGSLLFTLKDYRQAIACLDRATDIDPRYSKAYCNKGNAYAAARLPTQAIQSFLVAIDLDPLSADAHCNLGAAYLSLGKRDQAIDSFSRAISIDDSNTNAHFNVATALREAKRFEESNFHLKRVLEIDPMTELDCVGPRLQNNLQSCYWETLTREIEELRTRINVSQKTTELLPLLAISDDPFYLKKAGQLYCNENYPSINKLAIHPAVVGGRRIVLGYFSSDLCAHPVAFLTSEIYELHDRSKFEVHVFMTGRTSDRFTQRIRESAEHFWDCGSMGTEELIAFARERGLDVAIDLNGATQGARLEIFAARVAPVQVNYLGFPGSVGAEFHDYIIADSYVIPSGYESAYSEKIIRLPCFQVNDRKKRKSSKAQSRSDHGLPSNGFVFCCFNNTFKILPDVFGCWMRILSGVPGSVLWLSAGSADAKKSLAQRAERAGIAANRIVFKDRSSYEDYLASYECADLFLDTFPFNAGTTASDALWSGLPLITMSGRSFASRMAGSLLNAVGLRELVTDTLEDYQALALQISQDEEKIKSIRNQLANNSNVLFDSPLFVSSFESELLKIFSS